MGCPHGKGNTTREPDIDRRQFLLSAVAIGGTSALSACIDREEDSPNPGDRSDISEETQSNEDTTDPPGELVDGSQEDADVNDIVYKNLDKERSQHAWNRYLRTNHNGIPQPPRHQIVIMADVDIWDVSFSEREEMEAAFRTLERAYEWSNEGLLFTVGYSQAYFDQFPTALPESAGLSHPQPLSDFESPTLDQYDMCIHLASDHAQAILGAEEALFGNVTEINGVSVEHSLEGIVEKRDRRTGFVGEGLPANNQDVDGIPDSHPVPDEAPLYMGFVTQQATHESHPFNGETEDTFVHNQNSEYGVMIKEGRFEGGTTQQVSHLHLTLESWYNDLSNDERIKRMFSVEADADTVGEMGQDGLEATLFPGIEEFTDENEEFGFIGHSTKLARSREEGVSPLIRRDFNTTDEGQAGLHFVALQETISDFERARTMMNGSDVSAHFDSVDEQTNNGILEFIDVQSRANFLVPPRDLRTLPTPR